MTRQVRIHRCANAVAETTVQVQVPRLPVAGWLGVPARPAATGGDFDAAYRIVAWLCWVPNLAVAEWYVRRSRRGRSSAVAG